MAGRYSAAERARVLGMMRNQAAKSPDNTPNYTRTERETTIPRATLRNWWRAEQRRVGRVAEDEPEEERVDPATFGAGDVAWAREQLNEADDGSPDVKLVAGLLFERNSYTSPTARQAATKHLTSTVLELRRSGGGPDGPRTPREWVELVMQMPEVLVEALLELPELLNDSRIRAVMGGE